MHNNVRYFLKTQRFTPRQLWQQVPGPILVPSDVVVLDNLPAHQVASLAELVEARGTCLLYLPPHSTDFNPIELAFSKLRTWLRTA